MTTIEKTHQTPVGGGPKPETSGLTVLGWLLVCFAVPPLAMAAASYGPDYVWVGGVLLLIGLTMVLMGRRRRPPGDLTQP